LHQTDFIIIVLLERKYVTIASLGEIVLSLKKVITIFAPDGFSSYSLNREKICNDCFFWGGRSFVKKGI
jgi:hypothetical protein